MAAKTLLNSARCVVLLSGLGLTLLTSRVTGRASDSPLTTLIDGNTHFALTLLAELQSRRPGESIVVAPLSLSFLFGSIYQKGGGDEMDRELATAFGFPANDLGAAAHLLLSRFTPLPPIVRPPPPRVGNGPPPPPPPQAAYPEGAWFSNSIVYRGRDTLSDYFVESAKRDFAASFESIPWERSPAAVAGLPPARVAALERENVDVVLHSAMHLRTSWSGNTFSLSEPHDGVFHLLSGAIRHVDFLTGESGWYPYVETDTYTAAQLPCKAASVTAVLPNPGHTTDEIARALAATHGAIDAGMSKRIGNVDLVPFRVQSGLDLEKILPELGVRRVFTSLGEIIKIPRSYLSAVRQDVTILVDKRGVRADAETVGGAIYGGVMGGTTAPFRLTLDRPFLFFVHERVTGVVIFAGVVNDPGDVRVARTRGLTSQWSHMSVDVPR